MNNILNLNNTPLKYIITKNKNVINSPLISNDKYGPLVIYEPGITDYRELYISNYFLAGGYGAKSKEEQEKLSSIAENYDPNYNSILDSLTQLNNQYAELLSNKVTVGTQTEYGSDISYNTFNFNNESITLNELYQKVQNQIKNVKLLYKLEIYDVKYELEFFNNTTIYTNFSEVPMGAAVRVVRFTIKGNTKDSCGIEDIYVQLNNDNSEDHTYFFSIENLTNQVSLPTASNVDFEITIEKEFRQSDLAFGYVIKEEDGSDINHLFQNITILTKEPEDGNDNEHLKSESITDILSKYPSYFVGVESALIYTGNKTMNSVNINDFYKCFIGNTYTINLTSNTISNVFLLINVNKRLLKAEYYDYETNNVYDIIDFILTDYDYTYNGTTYQVIYKIEIKSSTNLVSEYSNVSNPPFLHKINNKLYLNEGKIVLTFSNSSANPDTTLRNTNQYWITCNGDLNIPL